MANEPVQAGQSALGDLKDDSLGFKTGGTDRVNERIAGELVAIEGLRRDVEEQQRVVGKLVCAGEGRAAAERVEFLGAADPLGDVGRVAGCQPTLGIRARERFKAENSVPRVSQLPDRLERDRRGGPASS